MSARQAVAERRRILVVDDVELNRVLTEAVLRGATYDVDSVGDGVSALAAIESKSYDLVLMDIEMPGLDGHEAAAAIRHRDRRPTKLAAISSQNSAAARLRSAEVGMAAHIARPIAPHALLREIERVFCQPPAETPDPWQRKAYDEWVSRLGAERMRGFLVNLADQFRTLLMLVIADGDDDALHRLAHDVASTSGMLGFSDVTRCCRAVQELSAGTSAADQAIARENLSDSLEQAIARLDRHFAFVETAAEAA